MYILFQLEFDLYQIQSLDPFFEAKEGTLLAIGIYLHTLGFKPDELEKAVMDMLYNESDSALFDGNYSFINSFNRESKAS